MQKRRLSKLISSEFKNYVPGELILNSEPLHWRNIALNDFSFPSFLPEGPAPGVEDYIFGLVYSGFIDGECSVNNGYWQPHKIQPNEFTLWQPFQSMNWRWWSATQNPAPIKIAITHLSSGLLRKTAIETMDMEPALIEMPNRIGVQDLFMQQMILALKHELTCGNPCGLLYPETIAQMLALHLLSKHCTFNRKTPEFKGGLSKNQLRCILDYLQSHWNQDISLDSMALLLGISSYHFLRQFKKSMGESPLQYLTRLRMEAAKRLLAQSDLSITEIALEVGYDGISHFIHLFKRHIGTTPAAYRKSL